MRKLKSNIKDIEIKYVFTAGERNELGPKIAKLSQDIQIKVDEKKAAVQAFNAEIKEIEHEFNLNVNRLNNGFEIRTVRARAYKNYATSEWEYYDVDSFGILKKEPFNSYDFQIDVDHAQAIEPQPFSELDEAAPVAEGTERSNPALFERLLRELNYWRERLAAVSEIPDEDIEIEEGIKINRKIADLEITLRTMQIKEGEMQQPVDGDESDDSWEQERKPDPTPEELEQAQDDNFDPHPGLTAAVVGSTDTPPADEEPDEDTKRGLNQIAKDLGDDPIFPDDLPENPTPKAEPLVDPTAEDDGRPKRKRNGVGKITFRGKDGEPLK